MRITIDTGYTEPLSERIFGHNLEHTRSAVNGGLSAQMLRNRKFAGKPSPTGVAAEWESIGDRAVLDATADSPEALITGDPRIIRMDRLYVMLYFRLNRTGGAFNTFACSYDLIRWTRWTGPPLIAPTESWENVHAHKPWLIRHEGVNYHFYCAVNDRNERFIAVAHS